jgi:outer membrane protein assembly factor BamB
MEILMPCLRSIIGLILCSGIAVAGDWPQWLGPKRDSSSPEKIAPWKEAPKVVWRKTVGEGHSSPVIAAGRVFLHTKVKDKNEEEVRAYDAKTGEELWQKSYKRQAFTSLFGNGPRATPTVVDGRVYTLGITGALTCFEVEKGTQAWQVDTLKKFEARNLFFGVSCSPLVVGKNVVVNVGGKGASVVAFDCTNGKVAWKSQDDGASYASPIINGDGKTAQIVFLTQKRLLGLQPDDGSLLWEYPFADKLLESSTTPVRIGELLLASSITRGSAGLSLESKDDKTAVVEKWKNEKLTCYFSTPVAVGKDHIYMVTGANPLAFQTPEAALRCVEAKTGKVLWTKEKIGKYHASLIRIGDDKLLLLDDSGNLALLEPNAKEYKELARSKVCGETWAHPALANGRLYIRDNKELICLEFAK